jgi:hypothetical protein
MMDAHTDDARKNITKIQKEIDELSTKAQSSSEKDKEEYTSKIQKLRAKKYEMLDEYHSLNHRGTRS